MRMLTFFKIVCLVVCLSWLPCRAQQVMVTKDPLLLADQYFAAGEYYTAANLYEQVLNPPANTRNDEVFPVYSKRGKLNYRLPKKVSREAVLYKQAESYRLAHYWLQADSTYKKCTDNIDALYWMAVCERSLGQYAEASDNLRQYLESTNTHKQFMEPAEQEWATLLYIKKQIDRPDTVLARLRKLTIPDSYERGTFAVTPIQGNQYLVSRTKTDSPEIKGYNPNNSHLFQAVLNNDTLTQITQLKLPDAGPLMNQGAANITANGNSIYFTQWQKQNGRVVSNIYVIKQVNGSWSAPQLVDGINTNGYSSKQPFCTADGKYLYFTSDRPGGTGGFDIWYAALNGDGSVGEPENAGRTINTTGDEQAPFYHSNSNTLVFSTNGRQGMGGFDLFSAQGNTITWSTPENIGYPVNSSRDDIYFYALEKNALLSDALIGSDRGSGCCLETYRINKLPKYNRMSGVVLDTRTHKPIPEANVVLTTPDGKTTQTTTDINGNYVFDNVDNSFTNENVAVSKQNYRDTAALVAIKKTDNSNLLTDQHFNTEIFIEKKFILRAENVVTVYFDFDMYNLKKEAVRKLDSVYNVLLEIPTATLQISGYTDGKGSNEYNAILSDHRARACAGYFIQKGIAASRITFESFGACCPLEMELINGRDNPDGRSKNRRALINITKE
ncbi:MULTISPECIES: OmpA family protein [Niastella]|uniref:OmpA family protein n=1 Tax=Niastella soli TaxID=2821487 RepID=A0ABS3YWQ2_9BACT|nr:OmpA family protein [Niastella soli]MBO9202350.1 OmpA family protein [Niastella soli]